VIAPFDPATVSVDPWTCQIDRYLLPEMDASDNCAPSDKLKKTITGPAGIVIAEEADGNYYAYGLPKGTHYFNYYATDCCGNVSLVQPFELTVIDDVAPVAIAKQYTVISLSNVEDFDESGDLDGIAKMYAESLDNGSYDRCTDVHLEIRRDGVYSSRGTLTDYPVDRSYPCGEVGNDSYNDDGHSWDIPSDSNTSVDPDEGAYVKFCCRDLSEEVVDANGDGEVDEADRGYHKVWLRVWDNADMSVDSDGNPTYGTAGDHYNDTWGFVKVEVAEPPILEVIDASIPCNWPYEQKFREGYFSDVRGDWVAQYITYNGICDVRLEVELDDSGIYAECPRGYFELIYTATNRDSKGLKTVKRQRVEIDDLEGRMACEDIEWPDSYQELTCLESTGVPELVWHADACELVGWTVKSDTFRFESGACIKVLNEYTVIDWCQYEWHLNGDNATSPSTDDMSMGYFEGGHDFLDGTLCEDPDNDGSDPRVPVSGVYKYVEVIKVFDDVAPEIEVRDSMYAITGLDCFRNVTLVASATDASDASCPETWFTWEVTVDINQNGVFDAVDWVYKRDRDGDVLRGKELTLDLWDQTATATPKPLWDIAGPNTIYKVQYIVYDGCGNVDKEIREIMITDKKPPTPYSVSLSSAVMNDGSVELWARDFNIGSFDNCYDQEELLYTFGRISPVPDLLDMEHYFKEASPDQRSKGAGEEATEAEYLAGEAQFWRPDDLSSAMIFDCDDVDASPVMVEMTVWDPLLNTDWAEVELTLVNNQPDACPDSQRAAVSGEVATEESNQVSEVSITLDNLSNPEFSLEVMTGNDGIYAFASNPMYVGYDISALKDGNDTEGVSTLDLVLIQRHILGIASFDSPYKLIAADINSDRKITGTDLVVLRKTILDLYQEFPTNTSWRFVEKNQALTVENALAEFNEVINISSLDGNMTAEDFVAVKIGDVNATARTNARDLSQTRSNGTLTIGLEEQEVTEGQSVDLTFSTSDFNKVYGYQFTLELNGLRIETVEGGAASMSEANIGILDENTVTVSYSDMEGIGSTDDLFTLTAIATQSGKISEMINLTSNVINSEGYVGQGLDIHTIELTINGAEAQAFSLDQNEPNPFDEVTVIGFRLPESGNATLTVYDVSGRVITNIRGNYAQGYNEIKLDKEDLNATGVLYYTLKSGDYNATKKMIIIE
jgi:hypothetical protein